VLFSPSLAIFETFSTKLSAFFLKLLRTVLTTNKTQDLENRQERLHQRFPTGTPVP